MKAFDPSQVLVIAVGIDRYEQQGLRLNGAAAYAEKLAKWALVRGVPADNVLLATSHLGPVPQGPPGVARRTPTYTEITRLLDEAATHEAELLLMYWCGHGVLNKYGERALFTADARVRAKHNHTVDELLRFLRSRPVRKLNHQIVIVDSCANFLDRMRLGERLPRTATLDIGDPRTVEQYVHYSAGQGQSAKHNQVTGLNAFSDAVFAWLEDMPAGPIAPQTDELTRRTRNALAHMRATVPGFEQMPVTVEISGTGLDDAMLYNGGGIPVSDRRFRDASRNSLDIVHTRHAAESCARLGEWLTTHAVATAPGGVRQFMRSALIDALSGTRFEAPAGNLDNEALAVRVFSTQQVGRLFELLEERIPTDAQQLDLALVRTLWLREAAIARIERSFPEATRRMVADAYRRAAPVARQGWRSNITEALRDLADLPEEGGQQPLHRFVAAMEVATGNEIEDTWYGIPGDQLHALRDAAQPHAEQARLVIEIPNATPDPARFIWPAGIREHRYTPGRGWTNKWHSCRPTPVAIRETVNRTVGDGDFTLGFLLPRAVFDMLPESWESGTTFQPRTPHWHARPVVLHSAERLQHRDLRHRWKGRHTVIRTHLEHNPGDLVHWVEHTDSEQIYRVVSGSKHACVGLAFVPADFRGEMRSDPIIAAIRAGAPYILWTSTEHTDWPSTRKSVDELVAERPFDELPALLCERRTHSDDLDSGIRLLWDDPTLVPEPGHLPGMQREAER